VALTQALVHVIGPAHAGPAAGLGAAGEALVATAKLAIRSVAHPELEARAGELAGTCTDSADAREGQRAFLAKRPPVFEGR
jgi:enoyl-CoA hydratase/carnithine racemase